MEGRRIVLNDGTILADAEAGLSNNAYLWLWIPGVDMHEAVNILLDSEKIRKIVFQYGNMEDVYNGFTICTNISLQNGQIIACMEKG